MVTAPMPVCQFPNHTRVVVRARCFGWGSIGVEQREDALRRSHRLLERVELVCEVLEWLIEATQQLKKRRNRAHRQRPDAHPMCTRHEENRQRNRCQEFDRGKVECIDRDRPEIRVEMRLVERREPLGLASLASEQLHDADARDALLEIRIDAREARADLAIGDAHARLEQVRREVHERNHRERRECEPPVGHHHQHRDGQQREEIAQAGDDASGEQLVERLDVGRHARYQSSYRRPIVERDGQSLHVLE